MLAEARRPSCPHHATRLTSPTKSGPSSNRCLSGPKGATDPQLARAPGRGRRCVLLAEERLLVAAAPERVPYTRQTVYYHFRRRWRIDGRLRRAHDRLREVE
jgi:hypothetical protein